MNQRLKFVSVLLSIVFIMMGCATLNLNKKPTQKQIVTGMYQIYNAQHKDYVRMASNPAITEAQKQILRQKKPILDKLGNLIPAFDSAIQIGTATPKQQQAIMDLLNSLEGL